MYWISVYDPSASFVFRRFLYFLQNFEQAIAIEDDFSFAAYASMPWKTLVVATDSYKTLSRNIDFQASITRSKVFLDNHWTQIEPLNTPTIKKDVNFSS